MANGKAIGLGLFVIGLLIIIWYGFYQGFQEIDVIDPIIALGVIILIVGLIALFVTIVIEQQKGKKKMKNEISEEDLEPW